MVETLGLEDERRGGNQEHIQHDIALKGQADLLDVKELADGVVGAELEREPKAERKQTGIHQLMDLHPNEPVAAQHRCQG